MANVALRGLRDFVPAYFPVPQNPILIANWDPASIPGLGMLRDFVPAFFPEPHNPISGMSGCGCGGGCGRCGMGAWNDEPVFTKDFPMFLQGKKWDIPLVYLWGAGLLGGAILLPMIFSGGGRRRR